LNKKKRNKLVSKIYKNEKKNISNLISNIMNFNNKETENTSGKYFPNKGVKGTLIKVEVDEN
jgi:hypothetical protein